MESLNIQIQILKLAWAKAMARLEKTEDHLTREGCLSLARTEQEDRSSWTTTAPEPQQELLLHLLSTLLCRSGLLKCSGCFTFNSWRELCVTSTFHQSPSPEVCATAVKVHFSGKI